MSGRHCGPGVSGRLRHYRIPPLPPAPAAGAAAEEAWQLGAADLGVAVRLPRLSPPAPAAGPDGAAVPRVRDGWTWLP